MNLLAISDPHLEQPATNRRMQLVSLLAPIPRRPLLTAIVGSTVSGIATMGALICVLESVRHGGMLWWQFACIAAIALLSRAHSRATLNRLVVSFGLQLRREMILSILRRPLIDLERTGSARLLVAFSSDMEAVSAAVRSFVSLFASSTFLLSCIAYLAWLSPSRATAVVLLLLLCIVVAFLLRRFERARTRDVREAWDQVIDFYNRMLDGIKEMKVDRALGRRTQKTFGLRTREHQQLASKRARVSSATAAWVQAMFFVILGTAAFGPFGDDPSLGTGYGLLAILYMRGTLQAFIMDTGVFAQASAAVQRITELGLTPANDPHPDNTQAASAQTGHWTCLALRDVAYRYANQNADRNFILGPLNLSFRPGEIVFVTGRNSSGKTTLSKILAKLYNPTSGILYFNDIAITDVNADWYRGHVGIVFSDFSLFDGAMTFGRDEMDKQSSRLMDRLQLNETMMRSPSYTFSAGERGRAALFAALSQDRPILIFDEWTAGQDVHDKDFFYTELLPSLKDAGKLVIAMTHDEEYFHIADRMIELGTPVASEESGIPPNANSQ